MGNRINKRRVQKFTRELLINKRRVRKLSRELLINKRSVHCTHLITTNGDTNKRGKKW